jgi:hypothetical protein
MSRNVLNPKSLLLTNPELSLVGSGSSSGPCSPGSALAYVSTHPSDHVKAPGLTLLIQARVCQRYARRRLRKCVKATFADRGSSLRTGFHQLLAHLTICRNHLVVVHRLDRLPLSGIRALAKLGTRIVSATGERMPRRQAEFLADIARLARQRR